MNVEVKNATIENLKEIQNLNQDLFKHEIEKYDSTLNSNWPLTDEGEEYFKERISLDNGCAFILVLDKKILGYLIGCEIEVESYRNLSNLAELENMFILEQYRKGGFGKILYDAFIKWCKSKNIDRIKVVASAKNSQALKFYRKQGFEDYDLTLEKKI